ncbi:MAG: hypothetical protein ABFR63_11300 [Thermodesulfobacteriota bacterium]
MRLKKTEIDRETANYKEGKGGGKSETPVSDQQKVTESTFVDKSASKSRRKAQRRDLEAFLYENKNKMFPCVSAVTIVSLMDEPPAGLRAEPTTG